MSKQDYTDPNAIANRFAECIVVQDGKLAHVGDVASVPADLAKQAEQVDLVGGKLVVPGFIDGHTHGVIDVEQTSMPARRNLVISAMLSSACAAVGP